ncbi:MAG TPA: HAD-IC family P-type ATPase, partial [Candidatus Saccharimonadales bacterium]|nr:HAD-IC family P-type ATPase [Candidatus Saccharimonadales bacterium]
MQVGSDKRLNYYRMAPQEVIAELRSHPMGLTNPEAARRLARHGINRLHRAPRTPLLLVFLRQFKSLFVLILLISAVFALYLHDGKTATMLLIIAAVNAAVGFFQEYKAERLLASLEQLLLPTAKVIRNGQVQAVDSTAVVVGDIVALEAGDAVPADIRILDENELATNDFALTGESNPTRKFVHAIAADVPLAARQNLAFMGTTVATGSGRGIAISTGMQTELGRIASLSQATHTDESPLQREMNNLATRITQGTLLLAAVLLIVALRADLGLKAALLFAISISAAMIPNGLVAEVNLTLAQTADRMARARALVKKLSAVETLGATDTILTDKTGTLTKNQMTVTNMVIGRTIYRTSGTGYAPTGTILDTQGKALSKRARGELSFFFAAGALASNAIVSQPDAEHPSWYVLGDPTEGAIVTLARKAGVQTEQLNLDYE